MTVLPALALFLTAPLRSPIWQEELAQLPMRLRCAIKPVACMATLHSSVLISHLQNWLHQPCHVAGNQLQSRDILLAGPLLMLAPLGP